MTQLWGGALEQVGRNLFHFKLNNFEATAAIFTSHLQSNNLECNFYYFIRPSSAPWTQNSAFSHLCFMSVSLLWDETSGRMCACAVSIRSPESHQNHTVTEILASGKCPRHSSTHVSSSRLKLLIKVMCLRLWMLFLWNITEFAESYIHGGYFGAGFVECIPEKWRCGFWTRCPCVLTLWMGTPRGWLGAGSHLLMACSYLQRVVAVVYFWWHVHPGAELIGWHCRNHIGAGGGSFKNFSDCRLVSSLWYETQINRPQDTELDRALLSC